MLCHVRFYAGNLETLLTTPTKAGIDVRAAVADWHARHYSANLMTAAVYGRHSLDELQQLVTDAFAGVTNTGLQAPQFPEDLYTDEVRWCCVTNMCATEFAASAACLGSCVSVHGRAAVVLVHQYWC
jgi:secreted Zn-dependent insulinase-like peptidase